MPEALREISGLGVNDLGDDILTATEPLVLRGLVQIWLGKDTHTLPAFSGDAPIEFLGASLLPQSSMKNSRMHCGAPIVMMAVGDARGIRTAQFTMGSQALALLAERCDPSPLRALNQHEMTAKRIHDLALGLDRATAPLTAAIARAMNIIWHWVIRPMDACTSEPMRPPAHTSVMPMTN